MGSPYAFEWRRQELQRRRGAALVNVSDEDVVQSYLNMIELGDEHVSCELCNYGFVLTPSTTDLHVLTYPTLYLLGKAKGPNDSVSGARAGGRYNRRRTVCARSHT